MAALEARVSEAKGAERIELLAILFEHFETTTPNKSLKYGEMLRQALRGSLQHRQFSEHLYRLAKAYINQEQFAEAEAVMVEAIEQVYEHGFRDLYVLLLQSQAVLARKQGQLEQALSLLAEASQVADSIGDRSLAAKMAYEKAIIFFFQGHYQPAIELTRAAQLDFKSLNDWQWQGKALNILGILYGSQGRMDESLDAMMQALAIAKQQQDHNTWQALLNNIGVTLDRLDKWPEAIDIYQQALDLAIQLQDTNSEALALINIGMVHRNLEQFEFAERFLNKGIDLAASISDLSLQARALNGLSTVHRLQGKQASALEYAQRADRLAFQSGDVNVQIGPKMSLAQLYLANGQYAKAQIQANKALDLGVKRDAAMSKMEAHHILAEIASNAGEFEAAYQHMLLYHQLFEQVFNEKSDKRIAAERARFESENKDREIERLAQEKRIKDIELERQEARQVVQLAVRKQQRNWLILGMLLIFAVSFYVYKRRSQKRLTEDLRRQVAEQTKDLKRKNEELQKAYQLVEMKSVTDELTGLNNRRFFMQNIASDIQEVNDRHRTHNSGGGEHLLFFLIDIDHFKSINDNYGHAAGDLVLTQMSSVLQQVFRQTDYLIRWGGEEFLVVMRFVAREAACEYAERLRKAVAEHDFKIDQNQGLTCTVSIGFASYPLVKEQGEQYSWIQIIDVADLCLYTAKRSGRDAWVSLDCYEVEHTDNFFVELLAMPESTITKQQIQVLTSSNTQLPLIWQ